MGPFELSQDFSHEGITFSVPGELKRETHQGGAHGPAAERGICPSPPF